VTNASDPPSAAPVRRAPSATRARLARPPEAILFDLDGTLVATSLSFDRMRDDLLRVVRAYGAYDASLATLDMLSVVEQVAARMALRGRELAFRSDAEDAMASLEVAAAQGATEIPPALSVLQQLAASGIKIGIVTRNCRAAAEEELRRVPLAHHLLLTRSDVRLTKPHPEQLLTALRLLNARPAYSVMVGDHHMDVQGGRAAGMLTVGLLRPGTPHTRFASHPPDLLVHTLEQLLPWTLA